MKTQHLLNHDVESSMVAFGIMPILVFVVMLLLCSIIIFTVLRNAKKWHINNNSPRLSVEATIVGKRGNVKHSSRSNSDLIHCSSSTTYYITFQVESGDRMEFQVPDRTYGMLVEGDKGKLFFQGSKYLDFVRMNP